MRPIRTLSILVLMALVAAAPVAAQELGRRVVVVTVENLAPNGGTWQSPVWVGFHDGTFDLYDLGDPASEALERLAEDGDTSALEAAFAAAAPLGIQGVLASNGPMPPLAPGQSVSMIFDIDPLDPATRYFSLASMVLPTNDTFLGNDDPVAHPIYDARGNFVAEGFVVAGPTGALDAGTEVNDELAENVPLLGQATENTGDDEGGVIAPAGGFNAPGSGGVLDDPMFANADYTEDRYNLLAVRFERINLSGAATFDARLDPMQEVTVPDLGRSTPAGKLEMTVRDGGTAVSFLLRLRNLTGPIVGAHLHLAPAGQNGPVVVDLLAALDRGRRRMVGSFDASDVVGPLGDAADPLGALLAEMAGGTVYVNVHTEANPAGEIRGQVFPGDDGIVRIEAPDDGILDAPLFDGGRNGATLRDR